MNIWSYLAESFDLPILDWIAENLNHSLLDKFMPRITQLGDAGIIWILCAIALLCIPKYRKVGFGMGLSLAIGLLVCNMILKPVVGRMRPYDYQWLYFQKEITLLVDKMSDASFPSGHTIASFEAATVMMIHDKRLGIPALLLAIIIAFSRLYLYVHYPTDVLASIVLGIGIAFIGNFYGLKLYKMWKSRKHHI